MTPCGVDSLCSVYWSVLQPLVYVHSFVASQLVSNQKFYFGICINIGKLGCVNYTITLSIARSIMHHYAGIL